MLPCDCILKLLTLPKRKKYHNILSIWYMLFLQTASSKVTWHQINSQCHQTRT